MPAPSLPPGSPDAEARERILIVEDDARLASLLQEYLSNNGFQVDIESRGDRAVGRICKEEPALVILDLMLPGMSGFEVCRLARQSYSRGLLILTASKAEVDHAVGLEIGADDYVVKPVEPRILLARIRSLLRRTRNAMATVGTQRDDRRRADGEPLCPGSERRVVPAAAHADRVRRAVAPGASSRRGRQSGGALPAGAWRALRRSRSGHGRARVATAAEAPGGRPGDDDSQERSRARLPAGEAVMRGLYLRIASSAILAVFVAWLTVGFLASQFRSRFDPRAQGPGGGGPIGWIATQLEGLSERRMASQTC